MLGEGRHERCKWSILTGLLFLTTQQYSQWQIPDCAASWKWSSELGICLLEHRGSGSRYSVSFPDEGSRGHQPIRHSFSGRWRERRKKGSMTLPASTFNTGIHCKTDIRLCGNLLPDTVLVFSREKHFFPFPLIAKSVWLLNWEFTETTSVYPKTEKEILKWAHFEWISCHLLVFFSWSNSTPRIMEFEAFGFPPPCCKSGKGWGPCGEVTCPSLLTEAVPMLELKPRCPDYSIITKEL